MYITNQIIPFFINVYQGLILIIYDGVNFLDVGPNEILKQHGRDVLESWRSILPPFFNLYFNLFLFPAELYKMVCEPNETDLDIRIPVVMLPQDAGASLEKMLMNSTSGKHFLVLHNHKANTKICCAKVIFCSAQFFCCFEYLIIIWLSYLW